MNDIEFYRRKAINDTSRKKALSKASNRGNASVEWHKTNRLTSKTLPDFQKVMKQADKDWEAANNPK